MNIKVIYGKMLVTMSHVFGVDFAKKFDTRLRFHRTLNLKNPTSLADKVTYVELHKQSSLASMCTDKYAVRDYIREKGLEDILIPVVGGPWENVEDVDFDSLPDSFALKATHGCKWQIRSNLTGKSAKRRCRVGWRRPMAHIRWNHII